MKKFNYKKWVTENKHGKLLLEQQKGDANNDGTVNQADVDWVNQNWLQQGDVYDSNDNIVNLADLSLVTNNYGQGTSPENSPTASASTASAAPICYYCSTVIIILVTIILGMLKVTVI